MTTHTKYISWLNDMPSSMRKEIADVYIDTTRLDVTELESILCDINKTLSVIHRIKGGLAMIRFEYLHEMSLKIEQLGRQKHPDYTRALSVFITELKESISQAELWKVSIGAAARL